MYSVTSSKADYNRLLVYYPGGKNSRISSTNGSTYACFGFGRTPSPKSSGSSCCTILNGDAPSYYSFRSTNCYETLAISLSSAVLISLLVALSKSYPCLTAFDINFHIYAATCFGFSLLMRLMITGDTSLGGCLLKSPFMNSTISSVSMCVRLLTFSYDSRRQIFSSGMYFPGCSIR
jgi:hypothetical protein